MSIGSRDGEALQLVLRRSFSDAYVSSLEFEMQARRLTLALYGPLQGGLTTYLGTLTFFGASALALENSGGDFPESVRVSALDVAYDDTNDIGSATLHGNAGWTLGWSFDGIAYAEVASTIASLADEQ